ncbi:hypothetical protein [Paenibacillus lutrae]|uniref:hypothetical protein n=1 Tax=Paenibacillus lutrae TaxID=2078573 RepID=UPI001411C9EC|nr:hypothetical protein [Paenibacillus lutrae]
MLTNTIVWSPEIKEVIRNMKKAGIQSAEKLSELEKTSLEKSFSQKKPLERNYWG